MTLHTLVRSAAIAVMAGGLATAAAAPAAAQNSDGQTQQQIKTDWSDQKLNAFAAAAAAFQHMQAKWRTRIQNAECQEKKREVRQQANDAMERTIAEQGRSMTEYNQVYQATQQDDDVRQEVMERIQEQQNSG